MSLRGPTNATPEAILKMAESNLSMALELKNLRAELSIYKTFASNAEYFSQDLSTREQAKAARIQALTVSDNLSYQSQESE